MSRDAMTERASPSVDADSPPAGRETSVGVTVLFPVRNEGINLELMLRVMHAVVDCSFETIVVYDSLEDDTIPVIDAMRPRYPNLRGVHNSYGRGIHNAVRAGIEAARGEHVLLTVVDDLGPVLAIEQMLTLMQQGCDFVSGTRYAHGGRRLGGSFVGGVLSRLANRLFAAFSSTAFTDCTTGIKMFRRSALAKMGLPGDSVGWSFVFDLAIRAQAAGLRLGEVPIISIDRLVGGESTFRVGAWTVAYLKVFLRGVRQLPPWKRPRPPVLHPDENNPAIAWRMGIGGAPVERPSERLRPQPPAGPASQ